MKFKATKRLLAMLLATLMIIPAIAITGCGKKEASASDIVTENGANVTDAVENEDATPSADSADKVADDDLSKVDISNAFASGTTDVVIKLSEIEDYKIVYYDSAYAKLCAQRVQAAIKDAVGVELPLSIDKQTAVTDKEILVGKTNRDESIAVRSAYSRPNVYYDIKVSGSKLVIMAEGYKTLDYVAREFEQYVASKNTFDGSVISGDISGAIDIVGTSMFNRVSGTNLRVFHWNVGAPLLNLTPGILDVTDIPNKTLRGEVVADIILQLDPDIITTNEIYYGHLSGKFYDAFVAELSEFYNILDNAYYKSAPSNVCISNTGYETNQPATGDAPVIGAYKSDEVSIPENILYKKDIGLTVSYSGWRYLTEVGTITASSSNPNARVYFHGIHTAVFKNAAGKSFIISVGHYGDSKKNNTYAAEQYTAISYAATKAGVAIGSTPTIVTGDMYTWVGSGTSAGYNYWKTTQSFKDAQVDANSNANNNKTHTTFHTAGVRETSRCNEDFIWYKNCTALRFKVLVSMEIDDCSDHYPVMADLKI